jgi:hypothetical protein
MVAQQQKLPTVKADQPKQAAKEWSGAPRGYVNADLSKGEKEEFREWAQSTEGLSSWGMLCALCDDGYRVTVAQDAQGWKAAATNISGPISSRGLCLSGYASDAGTALLSLLYKHHVKLDGEWGTSESETGSFVR